MIKSHANSKSSHGDGYNVENISLSSSLNTWSEEQHQQYDELFPHTIPQTWILLFIRYIGTQQRNMQHEESAGKYWKVQ